MRSCFRLPSDAVSAVSYPLEDAFRVRLVLAHVGYCYRRRTDPARTPLRVTEVTPTRTSVDVLPQLVVHLCKLL